MVKPYRLEPGDRIGVIAPASAPEDMDALARGCAHLESRGYRIIREPDTYGGRGYLSDTDERRLEALNSMLARTDIGALFCARGGYGTLRLLPDVDYAAARNHPKLLIGYSDITALQLALLARANVPSISGPMVASNWHDLDEASETHFWRLVEGDVPYRVPLLTGPPPGVLRPGVFEGPIVGGNLTMVTRLLGTPYTPSFDGAILVIEDIGEPPYRIDGMLSALRLAGVLDRIGGMIFGQFTDGEPEADKPSLSMDEVMMDYADHVDGPVVSNFMYGHRTPLTSLPLGTNARLAARDGSVELTIVDAVVSERRS